MGLKDLLNISFWGFHGPYDWTPLSAVLRWAPWGLRRWGGEYSQKISPNKKFHIKNNGANHQGFSNLNNVP